MMVINNAFELGQIVYLTTDSEQNRRIITKIMVSINGITYELSCGRDNSYHYECEISETQNILAKTE